MSDLCQGEKLLPRFAEEDGDWADWVRGDPDPVNHPAHYTTGAIELIDFLEASPHLGPHEWAIFQYVFRFQNKGGVEDLKKARFYLDRLIRLEEG